MKWLLSLILVVNMVHAESNVSETVKKWAKESGFLDFLFDKGGCPELFAHLPEQSAEQLMSQAYQLRAKRKDCEAARYFHEVRRQWPVRPYYKNAWKELIMSYVLADDYVGAINEGNMFMDQMRGTPEVEEVHLVLINAVNMMMMKAGTERSQEWTEYSLGISKKQNDDNPYLKNLSFKSFLDKYPDSPNVSTVKGMMTLARNNHAEYHLKIGNYYANRVMPGASFPNYPGAIGRYDVVLKWGPIVSSYSQALYMTVESLYKMAQIIESNSISEEKLKEWLIIDSFRDKKPVDRKAVVDQIYAQIKVFQTKMNSETITQDMWIQKTKLLIEEKQK